MNLVTNGLNRQVDIMPYPNFSAGELEQLRNWDPSGLSNWYRTGVVTPTADRPTRSPQVDNPTGQRDFSRPGESGYVDPAWLQGEHYEVANILNPQGNTGPYKIPTSQELGDMYAGGRFTPSPSNVPAMDSGNGNVGIGTTAPTSVLDVNGSARIRSYSAVVSPQRGDMYFKNVNSADADTICVYNGTNWKYFISN